MSSPEYAEQFSPSQVEVPNYGFSDSSYWLRLRLRNESRLTDQWFLELAYANMHFVDLFSPVPDGDEFQVTQSGTLRPPSNRDLLYPQVVFNLSIPNQSEQTFYMRFENGASMTLPLIVWEPSPFFANSLPKLIWHGLFLGIMVGLLGYNLFLFISLRDISYLYLTLLLSGIIFYDVSQSGLLGVYIFPDLYFLSLLAIPFSVALIFIPLLLFNDAFVSAKELLPRMHVVNLTFVAVWAVLGISIFVVSYHNLALVIPSTIAVTLGLVALNGVLAWRNGFRATRFLLIAWAGLLVGLLLFVLTRMGIAPSNFLSENSYRLGFAWMAVCWSIAFADRINILKAETEKANRDLMRSEQRLTQTLEALPIGVVVYGTDQRPTFLNKRTAEILTNPERDIGPDPNLERTLAQAMSYYTFRKAGSDQAYPLEDMPVHRALQGEPASADDIEADLIDKRVPLEIWASPVFDDAGNVESAVVAFQDITERKQSEMALRASEGQFRVVVEYNFDGIIFMDRDRKIMYVSPSYTQLNGLSTKEMIRQSGVGFIHPDDQTYVAETFHKLLQQAGEKISEEYRIRHKNGKWVWIETNAINLLDDPDVQAVVLNSRNITERKKREAELANYRLHLEQLVAERTEELNAINEQLTVEMAERAVLEELLHKRIQWMSALALARQRIKGTADLPVAYENLSLEILQLLDAGSLFLLRWQERGEQVEFRCRPMPQGAEADAEAIRTSFEEYAPLRQKLEPREIVVLSADEVNALPEPICACLFGPSMQSLLLAPMIAGEGVTGVLGIMLFLPWQELSVAQRELVTKITLDLTTLAQEALFLEQTRTLVASEERNHLARDLHDSVTQVLFSASLVAEVLPQIWRRDTARGMQSLEELRLLTRGALAEMRTMLLELRPAAVAKSPLAELLTQLTEASTSRTALPFQLFIEKTPMLPEKVHAAFYRIAQEALNNVAKHAQASQVTVSLSAAPLDYDSAGLTRYEVKLVIEDDGLGFSAQNERLEHLGLGIMRERAADIQASLAIDSEIGQGTRLTLIWCGAVEGDS